MLKRSTGSSRADFLRHWRTVHVDVLVNRARHKFYNKRYVQNEFLPLAGFEDESFDGAAQMIPQSAQVLRSGFQDDPLYTQYVRPDEMQFLDVDGCCVLYGETQVIREVASSPDGVKLFILARRGPDVRHADFVAGWCRRARLLCSTGTSREALLGLRLHRVMPDGARRMADGVLLPNPPDVVEEVCFSDSDALHKVCASEDFIASFPLHGALLPGAGSHVFAAREHLVYDEA